MKVREKKDFSNPDVKCSSIQFNVHAIAEVICFWEDGDTDSMFIKDLDVYITAKVFNGFAFMVVGWKDMEQAFKDHDIIIDNYNACFFEPANEEDRKRGFTLN